MNSEQPVIAEVVLHDTRELDPYDACDGETIEAVKDRAVRGVRSSRDLPRLERCPAFAVACDGRPLGSWPSREATALQRTFVRGFLDTADICRAGRPRLFRVSWTAVATGGDDYLLVWPCGDGQSAGLVVVCVTCRLSGTEREARST